MGDCPVANRGSLDGAALAYAFANQPGAVDRESVQINRDEVRGDTSFVSVRARDGRRPPISRFA